MHQWFAAGNRNHRRAAFIHRLKTLFRRQFFFQNMRWVLNLSAAGARQVAPEQRLQHQNERISLAALNLLPQDVSCYCPGFPSPIELSCETELLLLDAGTPRSRNTHFTREVVFFVTPSL